MHSRALWGHFKPENRLAKIVRGFPCSVFLSQSTPSFLLTIAPHVTLRSIQSLVNFVLKINCAGRYLCITKTYQRSEDGTKRNKCVLLLQPRPSLSEELACQPQSCSDSPFLSKWYPWTRSLQERWATWEVSWTCWMPHTTAHTNQPLCLACPPCLAMAC